MGTLKAVGQSICVRVVEQRVVSIAPGKFLEGDVLRNESTTGRECGICPTQFLHWCEAGVLRAHLGADTQVRIRHKFRLLVRVRLHLDVGVGNADGDAGESQHDGQYLPGPRCGKTSREKYTTEAGSLQSPYLS